jgi:23S rRNA pseudouridine1911/1915/1917 synthase
VKSVSNNTLSHLVPEEEFEGLRLDKYLCDELDLFSRSQWKARSAQVSLGGKTLKPSYKIRGGEKLWVQYNDLPEPDFAPEEMNLDILYEDDDVIVLNKAQGVVVHPGSGNHSGTLVQGLLHYCHGLREAYPEDVSRPGIVHRLDKETSGVIIAAKRPEVSEHLILQFQKKRVQKEYYAVIKGQLRPGEGTIHGLIARDPRERKKFAMNLQEGKPSLTDYQVIHYGEQHSLVHLFPRTGRTHQLRVHMQHLGHPILGDDLYSRKDKRLPEHRLMLHAYRLSLKLFNGKELEVVAPLPQRFQEVFTSWAWEPRDILLA